MTTEQQKRTEQYFASIAKEAITVDKVGGVISAYGSEIAVLRLFAKYNANGAVHNKNARVGFSKNLNAWYFSLESSI